MSNNIEIVRTITELRKRTNVWRRKNMSVGLVPTMGALHAGHFSLVKQSITSTDRTIATLFVNPKQFGPTEGFNVYPRDEKSDVAALLTCGVDLLFAPAVGEMYGEGAVTVVSVPGIGDVLEGAFRPDFFTGVATVVAKLLIQSLPDRAFFGEKDYQQLQVIKRMAIDLDLPVEIVGCPTVREVDGLALSSRNAFLNSGDRKNAIALNQALTEIADQTLNGAPIAGLVQAAKKKIINAGFTKVDYLAVCDPDSLVELEYVSDSARVLGAAWLGKTRLIDNVVIGG
jgi:pantoate--beta-alanine ligase